MKSWCLGTVNESDNLVVVDHLSVGISHLLDERTARPRLRGRVVLVNNLLDESASIGGGDWFGLGLALGLLLRLFRLLLLAALLLGEIPFPERDE